MNLSYRDISKEQFNEVIDSWRSPHIWDRNAMETGLKTDLGDVEKTNCKTRY